MTIPEPDWRLFKEVRVVALDRLCHQILCECQTVCNDNALSAHHRYLKLYELIRRRDEDIQRAFDDFRRSAIVCLATTWPPGIGDPGGIGPVQFRHPPVGDARQLMRGATQQP